MHCYQPHKKQRKYSKDRMLSWSFLLAVATFCILFVPIRLWTGPSLRDDYVLLLLVGLILLYPTHKLFHIIPIIHAWSTIRFKFSFFCRCIPFLTIQIRKPLAKWHYVSCLTLPLIVIGCTLTALTISFPAYAHYFTILQAVHFGICASDLFILKSIVSCPKSSFIEENNVGFEVLVHETS